MKYGIFLSLKKLDEKPIKNLKKKLLNKVIGKKTYFHFPDSFKNKVLHKGGFKHPTNPKLIRLVK